MSKTTQFTVVGTGHFPNDMLRYDACWPSSSGDAVTMGTKEYGQLRTVRLRTERSGSPTVKRWESFGWNVGNIDKL
jgi:hypothetical protein